MEARAQGYGFGRGTLSFKNVQSTQDDDLGKGSAVREGGEAIIQTVRAKESPPESSYLPASTYKPSAFPACSSLTPSQRLRYTVYSRLQFRDDSPQIGVDSGLAGHLWSDHVGDTRNTT